MKRAVLALVLASCSPRVPVASHHATVVAVDTSDAEAPPVAPPEASASVAVVETSDAGPPPRDPELVRIEALIRGLPKRRLTSKEVCARIAAPGFVPPQTVVGWDEAGNIHLLDEPFAAGPLVWRCRPTNVYGSEILTPRVDCDPVEPRCVFTFVSGGREGTGVPPTERTFWFDTRNGKVELVVLAIPHMM